MLGFAVRNEARSFRCRQSCPKARFLREAESEAFPCALDLTSAPKFLQQICDADLNLQRIQEIELSSLTTVEVIALASWFKDNLTEAQRCPNTGNQRSVTLASVKDDV
jgi:hypothetical protein